MTRLVDAMERDAQVTRHPDPDDRRAVLLEATAGGRRALTRARAQRVAMLAAGVRSLSPAQLSDLAKGVQVLERMMMREG